jgi:hypothetical protein
MPGRKRFPLVDPVHGSDHVAQVEASALGRIVGPSRVDGSGAFFYGAPETKGTGPVFDRQGGEILKFSR